MPADAGANSTQPSVLSAFASTVQTLAHRHRGGTNGPLLAAEFNLCNSKAPNGLDLVGCAVNDVNTPDVAGGHPYPIGSAVVSHIIEHYEATRSREREWLHHELWWRGLLGYCNGQRNNNERDNPRCSQLASRTWWHEVTGHKTSNRRARQGG